MSIDPDEEFRRLECDGEVQEVSKSMLIVGATVWIVVILGIAWIAYG